MPETLEQRLARIRAGRSAPTVKLPPVTVRAESPAPDFSDVESESSSSAPQPGRMDRLYDALLETSRATTGPKPFGALNPGGPDGKGVPISDVATPIAKGAVEASLNVTKGLARGASALSNSLAGDEPKDLSSLITGETRKNATARGFDRLADRIDQARARLEESDATTATGKVMEPVAGVAASLAPYFLLGPAAGLGLMAVEGAGADQGGGTGGLLARLAGKAGVPGADAAERAYEGTGAGSTALRAATEAVTGHGIGKGLEKAGELVQRPALNRLARSVNEPARETLEHARAGGSLVLQPDGTLAPAPMDQALERARAAVAARKQSADAAERQPFLEGKSDEYPAQYRKISKADVFTPENETRFRDAQAAKGAPDEALLARIKAGEDLTDAEVHQAEPTPATIYEVSDLPHPSKPGTTIGAEVKRARLRRPPYDASLPDSKEPVDVDKAIADLEKVRASRGGDEFGDQSDIIEGLQRDKAAGVPVTRARLQARIIKSVRDYGKAEAVKAGVTPRNDGEVVFLIGPPGSGKSTIANKIGKDLGAYVIDSDPAKLRLPEYLEKGATGVHEESSHIAAQAVDYAVRRGENVIVPTVGKSRDALVAKMNQYKAAGAKVHVVLSDLDAPEASVRAFNRGIAKGRDVPMEYVLNDVGDKPRQTFEHLKTQADLIGDRYVRLDQSHPPEVPLHERVVEKGQGANYAGAERRGRVRDHGAGARRALERRAVKEAAAEAKRGNGGLPRENGSGAVHVDEPAPRQPEKEVSKKLPGLIGDEDHVTIGDRRLKVRHRVVEAADLIPSNNPFNGFERDARYPQSIQGRVYSGEAGKGARERVVEMAGKLEPAGLTLPSRSVHGAPIVTEDGHAIVGNQRVMAWQLAGENPAQAARMKQQVVRDARKLGVDPGEVEGMKNPIVVREISDPSVAANDHEQLAKLNQLSDVSTGKAKDPRVEAAGRARQMQRDPAALEYFATHISPDETINEFLRGRHGPEMLDRLVKSEVLRPQELDQFRDPTTNKLTKYGRERIQEMVQGAAVGGDPAVLDRAPESILAKLDQSWPRAVAAENVDGWSLEDPLKQALSYHGQKADNGLASIADLVNQGEMFGSRKEVDSKGITLARFIESHKKAEITEAFREYAEAAQTAKKGADAGADMFGHRPEKPDDAFKRIFALADDVAAATRDRKKPSTRELASTINYATEAERARNNVHESVAGFRRAGAIGKQPELPEKIKAPAIRLNDGRVVEGTHHMDAWQKSGVEHFDYDNMRPENEGFTTTRGRYVTREEAMDIAEREDQLTPSRRAMSGFSDDQLMSEELRTEDLPHGRRALDSEDLNPEITPELARQNTKALKAARNKAMLEHVRKNRKGALGSVAGDVSQDPHNIAAAKMLSSIAGGGTGAAIGGALPGTPEEKRARAVLGLGVGLTAPFAPEIVEQLAAKLRSIESEVPAKIFRMRASAEDGIRVTIQGKPDKEQLGKLLAMWNNHPNGTKFGYSVRDLEGRDVGRGDSIIQLYGDLLHADSNKPLEGPRHFDTGAIGNQPERIKSAAIRTPAGKIVEGDIHPFAWSKARDEGHIARDNYDDYETGFTTTHGRFVGRDEAYRIADQADQISGERIPGAHLDASELEDNPLLKRPGASEELSDRLAAAMKRRSGTIGNQPDMFGHAAPEPAQGSLLDESAGAAGPPRGGSFDKKAADAKVRADFLMKQLKRMSPGAARDRVAREVADLSKIANFGEKIGGDEMRARAIAGDDDGLWTASYGSVPVGKVRGGAIGNQPALRQVSKAAQQITGPTVDAMRESFAPANRGLAGRTTGGIIRHATGDMARGIEQAGHLLETFADHFDDLGKKASYGFMDRLERGLPQPTPELTKAAASMRKLLDDARTQIQALGTGKLEQFIENYFPHIWEDPDNAKGVIARILNKQPLVGPASFLRQRSIPTIADGLAAGLKPVSDNPVDLVLLKLHEMNRYLTGQRILQEMKDAGLVKFVRATEAAPDGYLPINDKIATIHGPLTDEGAKTIRGSWVAQAEAATVLNNYLSPGLRQSKIALVRHGYRGFMGLSNVVNQAQLGLSAFHLGFTSMDAIVSKNALAVEQLAAGKPLRALASFAESPIAPVTTYFRGSRVLREYYAPGSVGGIYAQIADALPKAGGRVKMDRVYKNNAIDKMVKLLREEGTSFTRPVKATALAIPAALELAAKPILEHLVPRQKLGVFFDLARHELERMGPNAAEEEVRQALGKVWDSVDNRMGQLVYDNLFWNKAAKDLAMASVRSVGWNLGTIREVAGGAGDIVAIPYRLAKGERAITHKAAYAISLPITVGLAGGVIHYLYTGETPKDLKDYFYPKTGRKNSDGDDERVQLPSYMKDVAAYTKHPWGTVKHKLNPLVATVAEMLNNEDYYGDEIRNPDDPFVKKRLQEAEFVWRQVQPFGIQNWKEQAKRDQPASVKVGSLVGLTPAPRDAVRTDAENKMAEYIKAGTPGGATPEEAEKRHLRAEIRRLVREHKPATDEVRDAARSGQLTKDEIQRTVKSARIPALVSSFKKLTLEQAIDVYRRGTPAEKAIWRKPLLAKHANARNR